MSSANTLTLPRGRRRWRARPRPRLARSRKAQLRRAGYTYADLAAAARVTLSMVFKWMNAERKSTAIAAAFAQLVAHPRVKGAA